MTLNRVDGSAVTIHPNVFHRALEPLPARQRQIEQTTKELVLRIVPGPSPVGASAIVSELNREITVAGADPPAIRLECVDAIAKTPLGKAPLVTALRGASELARMPSPTRQALK